MPRGGHRRGAGRKKGSRASKTKARLALVERLSAGAPTPLDVMLAAMEDALSRGDMPAAAAFANDAALTCIHDCKPSCMLNSRPGRATCRNYWMSWTG